MNRPQAPLDDFPAKLRGTGPVGIAAAILIVGANLLIAPLGALLVLVWRWLAKVRWVDIGFRATPNWALTFSAGLIGGILFKLLMKALVMPLLGGPAVNPAFHSIAGNTSQMISMIAASIIVGGLGEEIVYRGFLFDRLWRVLGESGAATVAIILVTTALFASIHIPEQGWAGAEQALFTGAAFGTIYAVTRSLWLPIILHATFDVTAVLLIYFGWEGAVAHSIVG